MESLLREKRYAYLDIETTGLVRDSCELTVVGIAIEQGGNTSIVQLIGEDATDVSVMAALAGSDELYTYNGGRFDLPVLKKKLGLDLAKCMPHTDLMRACWKHKLKGGLKRVEEQLGIARASKGIDGWMAVQLWWQYVNNNDNDSLRRLLEYNAEDVLNMRTLRLLLGVV
jgi:uncharacterized protein